MEDTLLGIEIVVNPSHPLKALLPIATTFSPITKFFKLLQLPKAY
jgi:hypothetical protein